MGKFDWIVFDKGRARLCGSQRDADGGGQEIFAAQIAARPEYYGEFVVRYADDRTNYVVEVLSFGFGRRIDAEGRFLPIAATFSAAEIADLKLIISGLFLADQEKPFPLNQQERFLGRTRFRPGWVREA